MRFVHSLVRIKNGDNSGWCAPVELGESTPQYISFVIPVDPTLDPAYSCEIVSSNKDKRIVSAKTMFREGKNSFLLDIDDEEVWFNVRPISKDQRRLPYIGKLEHEDFGSLLMEIEPEETSVLDRLFLDKGVGIIGCDPFAHYSGVDKIKHR
jgi:hypothetical protein